MERIERVNNFFKKISPRKRLLDKASEIANKVISKDKIYSKMSEQEMLKKSYLIMEEIKSGIDIDNFLIDGLALIREMIFRVYNQKAYKVQLIGAVIVHFGDFSEMATGEGKTLTLLLAAYVNALSKKGVHIVTVNEYLVERDAQYAKDVMIKLGVTVGYVNSAMKEDYKKEMYGCDITYITNSELGFDYLRDNMVTKIEDKMQRGLNFAIVDEGDSVLIDEARTPLIIAGSPDDDISLYVHSSNFVKTLNVNDYVVDQETHAINLNDNGIIKAQNFFMLENLYDIENSDIVHRLMNALRAEFLMINGKEYIVRISKETGEEEIALVDSFTGRILDGRMYSSGLHQAIQSKEKIRIEPENVTIATVTYQSLFRIYKKLSAVSGTALTEQSEFMNIYNMVVVDIPSNKPIIRKDHPDYVFATKEIKWKYVVADIKKRHSLGQPILVGTSSVEDSELLHRLLDKVNIKHEILNAKNNFKEAEIIKKAGQLNQITIATNMAGRGTDIKLGEGVKEVGGLFVLGTERNESRRIDNQLRGRAGRQGDPGESRFFISLQDTLFKRFATDKFDKAQYKLGDDIIDLKFFSKLLDKTQKKIENMNFDIRKNLIDYDYVLSEQRELIYKQRDIILKTNDILKIVNKMVPHIVLDLIIDHRNQENINMVDIKDVINKINDLYLQESKLDFESYREYNEDELTKKLIDIFKEKVTEKYKLNEKENFYLWKKTILFSFDFNWTKFLDKVQKLRDGVSLRSYEQKSPLNIYVEDSDRMFHMMTKNIANEVIINVLKLDQLPKETTFGFSNNTSIKEHSINDMPLSQNISSSENIFESENINDEFKQSYLTEIVKEDIIPTKNKSILDERFYVDDINFENKKYFSRDDDIPFLFTSDEEIESHKPKLFLRDDDIPFLFTSDEEIKENILYKKHIKDNIDFIDILELNDQLILDKENNKVNTIDEIQSDLINESILDKEINEELEVEDNIIDEDQINIFDIKLDEIPNESNSEEELKMEEIKNNYRNIFNYKSIKEVIKEHQSHNFADRFEKIKTINEINSENVKSSNPNINIENDNKEKKYFNSLKEIADTMFDKEDNKFIENELKSIGNIFNNKNTKNKDEFNELVSLGSIKNKKNENSTIENEHIFSIKKVSENIANKNSAKSFEIPDIRLIKNKDNEK